MKKGLILFLVILIIAVYFFTNKYYENQEIKKKETAFVTKVTDGDTINLLDGRIIRLLGIDTAEKGEKCYKEAKARLEELVYRKEIILERDIENKDKYSRYLRYILINDTNINILLVQEGLAFPYYSSGLRYEEEIKEAAENAVGKGCLWN